MRILGTGSCLGARRVTAAELEEQLHLEPGWIARHTGVETRYFVDGETASQLGASAARQALEAAELTLADIDCLVAASGTSQQPLPCRAALLAAELGLSGRPAFDVDCTCLSFLVALDLLATSRYRRVLLVSADVASAGLDWSDPESATLFGDGAAAAVLEPGPLLAARLATWPHPTLCQIPGGGTARHPRDCDERDLVFQMDGPGLYRLAAEHLPPLYEGLLADAGHPEVEVVIPHQASPSAMRLVRRRLGLRAEQWHSVVERMGNLVAASLPAALDDAIRSGRLGRGQVAVLLGTSAGFAVGGVALRY